MQYNTAIIRELLQSSFSDEELQIFSFDYFRPVYEQFGDGMSRLWKIQLLIDYCERHDLLKELLEHTRRLNPKQYSNYSHLLNTLPHRSQSLESSNQILVEIVLKGNFSSLTSDVQSAAVGALAGILDIPRNQISILEARLGSVILLLKMPTEAVKRLISLVEAYNPSIQDVGIEQINTSNKVDYRAKGTIKSSNHILSDWEDNIEQSIHNHQQALKVTTREDMPVIWATIMHNLADAYASRKHGNQEQNIAQAINIYQQALEVRTLDLLPLDHRQTLYNLGDLYFNQQQWPNALIAYQAASSAVQLLLDTTYTESALRIEAGETARLYAQTAYCLWQMGQAGEALYQLEQGKTRILAETFALGEAYLAQLPSVQRQTVYLARQIIADLERELRQPPEPPSRRNDHDLVKQLRQARADFNQLIQVIRAEHSNFIPTGLKLPELLAIIPIGGALIAPFCTSQGSAVFVIPHGTAEVTQEHIISLNDFTDENLQGLLYGDDKTPGWLQVYLAFQQQLTTLNIWQATIDHITHELWKHVMEPVHKRLQTFGLPSGSSTLIMPQGGLGLLPLHAAWGEVEGQKRYFLDDYIVTYAPSGYALSVSQQRIKQPQRQKKSLFAAVNSTDSWRYGLLEGGVVAALFPLEKQTVLNEAEATAEAVIQAVPGHSYIHFSYYGFYHWQDPIRSELILAGAKYLTLSNIIGHLDMSTVRLVTFSVYETGTTNISKVSNEYVELPAGFLQAGAPAVVSNFWAVNSLSTVLLMERFYQLHLQKELDIANSLRQAQLWLRDITAGELVYLLAEERVMKQASIYRLRFAAEEPEFRPFAHPYYWAAFMFTGA